jgi:hypothetical protein
MTPARRTSLAVFAATLLYYDVAILANEIAARAGVPLRLPVAAVTAAFLNVYPVFPYYLQYNMDFAAEVRRASDGSWRPIALDEHFRLRRGELHARLLTDMRPKPGRALADPVAWSFLDRQIRARHAHLHPGEVVDRLRVVQLRWPRSPEGWLAQRTPATTERRLVYETPAP